MSATTLAPTRTDDARATSTYRVTFPHLLRSEWIKFWSVRSTVWTLSILFVVTVGLVLLISLAIVNAPADSGAPQIGPDTALDPFSAASTLGQLAVAVLGVLTITGEYTTGMIRSSLTAEPRRLPVLWAKAIIVFFVILFVAIVSLAVAAGLQYLLFDGKGLSVDVGSSAHLRALFGNALYTATVALLAFALGALLRHSAAAMATVLGALLVLPILLSAIPWKPLQYVFPFLPNVAGSQITQTDAQIEAAAQASTVGADLSAWQGYGVLVAYVVVVLAVAAVLLKKRDA